MTGNQVPSSDCTRSSSSLEIPRRKFIGALTENWWRARDAFMPTGPKTRDERYVWEALRRARTEDVSALDGRSAPLVVPCDPAKQWHHIEPNERASMSEHDTVRMLKPNKMTPELMDAWLAFHPEWVKHETARVVAEAMGRLRQAKRDRRAVRRANRRRVGPRGRQRWVNPRGRPPGLKTKLGTTKRTAKKVVSS